MASATSRNFADETPAERRERIKKLVAIGAVTIGAAAVVGWLATRYKTSLANEWLVRTGLGVHDMQIAKKFIHWPYQNIQRIHMTPTSFKFAVNAMSREKMEFNFPAVFTVGPKNDNESLEKYCRFLLGQSMHETESLICGIIEGETRSLSANLSIEDIFTGRAAFKQEIVQHVKSQLDQYGLEIYNANIEELKDSASSNYFASLSQKIKAEAANKAKVDVAEQNKKGDIGAKERQAETRQRVAVVEAETTLVENSRQQDIIISRADMEKTKAEQELIIQQAKIRGEQQAETLRMQLLKEVEMRRQEMELEKKRAVDLTKSKVAAEIAIKDAEGAAESQRLLADASLYQKQKEAEAHLYAQQKEAEGVEAMYRAQAEGITQLIATFNGDSRAVLSYFMLEKGMYEKLADANARAVHGMQPKISVWSSDASSSMDTIQSLGKSVIPMLDTIQHQTGYGLPSWLLNRTGAADDSGTAGITGGGVAGNGQVVDAASTTATAMAAGAVPVVAVGAAAAAAAAVRTSTTRGAHGLPGAQHASVSNTKAGVISQLRDNNKLGDSYRTDRTGNGKELY